MAVTQRTITLGTPAPRFELQSVDGNTVSIDDFADAPALLVAFMCNHCPYARHIESGLGALATELRLSGLATVAICSNDADNYPNDRPEALAEQRRRSGWDFPYLIDASQAVALDHGAVCTPDLFVFDVERRLAYHGAFDGSRPGNDVPVTGKELRDVAQRVLAGEAVPEPHMACLGCGIKWLRGNEPTL